MTYKNFETFGRTEIFFYNIKCVKFSTKSAKFECFDATYPLQNTSLEVSANVEFVFKAKIF